MILSPVTTAAQTYYTYYFHDFSRSLCGFAEYVRACAHRHQFIIFRYHRQQM